MAEPLKNRINKKYLEKLALELKKRHSSFPKQKFIHSVMDKSWSDRELKERLTHICKMLGQHLPKDYLLALEILLDVAPHFGGFEALFFPDFVAHFGMTMKHRKKSLRALAELTQYSSSEFAIRPFIIESPQETMKWMLGLASHSNQHMRRLASEGCRPRLPWAPALPEFKKDPSLIIPILEKLKNDPELYVRRSVANNINDLCKDNPDITLELLKNWKKKTPSDNVLWVINHGLRTLIKDGDQRALSLVGYRPNPAIIISGVKLSTRELRLGDHLEITAQIKSESTKPQNLLIDYIVYHRKKNGETTPKVFKLKKIALLAGQKLTLRKIHKFQKITTRKYYSGEHFIQFQVNGVTTKKFGFVLHA